MAELPALVKDLALILIVASMVTLIFKRLKQPLVLGYIVAGFIVSPHLPLTMSVVDKADDSEAELTVPEEPDAQAQEEQEAPQENNK